MNRVKKVFLFSGNRMLIITAVALLEAILIFVGGTFSWIEGTKNGKLTGDNCTIKAGSGLVFSGDSVSNGKISLSITDALEDCSSTDGRNFFFPTTGSLNKNVTATDVFRIGNTYDKNSKYVSVDFNVTSIEDSGTGTTPIYIDNSSFIKSTGDLNAIRMSVNFNDGTEPKVICPGVSKSSFTHSSAAVASISDAGAATTTTVTSYPLSKYWYNNATPIGSVENGKSKRITVTIWLEGCDDAATTAKMAGKTLDASLIFSTAQDYTKTVTFVDYSPSKWVKDGNNFLYAIDKSTVASGQSYLTGVAYQMTRAADNITYTSDLPSTVTDVMFVRYDPDDETKANNAWNPTRTMSNSDINTFYNIGQGESVDRANYGYWVESSCTGVADIYLTDNNGKYSNNGATAPNIHFASTLYGTAEKTDAYGYNMKYAGLNNSSKRVYHLIVPADSTIFFSGFDHYSNSYSITSSASQTSYKQLGYYFTTNYAAGTNDSLGTWDPSIETPTWPRV